MTNIKISDKDKVLLGILAILVALTLPFFCLLKPMIFRYQDQWKILKEAENRKEQLMQLAMSQGTYEDKTLENVSDIAQIANMFPNELSQEETLSFLYNTEQKLKVSLYQSSFETNQNVNQTTDQTVDNTEDSAVVNAENAVIATRSEISYEAGYDEFLKLLNYIQNYDRRMVITNLTATYASELNTVSGNFTLVEYALPNGGKAQSQINIPKLPTGTTNIFKQGAGSVVEQNQMDADFFLMLSQPDAQVETFNIGKGNDTEKDTMLTCDDNLKKEVGITFVGSNGAYFASYYIGDLKQEDVMFQTTKQGIYYEIISSKRTGENDLVEAKLKITNHTDLPVYITIVQDDTETPRVQIFEKTGDILVQ